MKIDRNIPLILVIIAGIIVTIMLSPLVAREHQHEPHILRMPFTLAFWFIGSVVLAALGIGLGIWALRKVKKE